MTIPNMACSACGEAITQAVVQANPKTKRVVVDTQASQSHVQQAIEMAGYPVENVVVNISEYPAEQRATEDLNQDLCASWQNETDWQRNEKGDTVRAPLHHKRCCWRVRK